jgi:hypothetical protein
MEPDDADRPGREIVPGALGRLLFVIWILLGLAFAVVCYAEMFGVFQFD